MHYEGGIPISILPDALVYSLFREALGVFIDNGDRFACEKDEKTFIGLMSEIKKRELITIH